jgi:hypothetical protein
MPVHPARPRSGRPLFLLSPSSSSSLKVSSVTQESPRRASESPRPTTAKVPISRHRKSPRWQRWGSPSRHQSSSSFFDSSSSSSLARGHRTRGGVLVTPATSPRSGRGAPPVHRTGAEPAGAESPAGALAVGAPLLAEEASIAAAADVDRGAPAAGGRHGRRIITGMASPPGRLPAAVRAVPPPAGRDEGLSTDPTAEQSAGGSYRYAIVTHARRHGGPSRRSTG